MKSQKQSSIDKAYDEWLHDYQELEDNPYYQKLDSKTWGLYYEKSFTKLLDAFEKGGEDEAALFFSDKGNLFSLDEGDRLYRIQLRLCSEKVQDQMEKTAKEIIANVEPGGTWNGDFAKDEMKPFLMARKALQKK
jgi:hypothetical protein